MPSEHLLFNHNFSLIIIKSFIFTSVIFTQLHKCVAVLPENNIKHPCSDGQIASFEDNAVCVILLDGSCEENKTVKVGNFRCGPGSVCLHGSCKCIQGYSAHKDGSGCTLVHENSTTNFPTPVNSTSKPTKLVGSTTGRLKTLALQRIVPVTTEAIPQSTKVVKDHVGKNSTAMEDYVVHPTTVIDTASKENSTAPITIALSDPNTVVLAPHTRQLISRTGASNSGGYHKGSYYGTQTGRNNSAISIQKLNVKSVIVCSIISVVAFGL